MPAAGTEERLAKAVRHFWKTRSAQSQKQKSAGRTGQGSRGAVTGGAQMDGFVRLFSDLALEAGVTADGIQSDRHLELPGFFRPTKKWDLLVIHQCRLLAVLEFKSQVGPSFGNNFNNRTEEAMGSATDIWTAYREGAFGGQDAPWLGYFFMLESSSRSTTPVKVEEPHFKVFPEFVDASYMKRYELLCRKLRLERLYSATAFIASSGPEGRKGLFDRPSPDLAPEEFIKSFVGHLRSHL